MGSGVDLPQHHQPQKGRGTAGSSIRGPADSGDPAVTIRNAPDAKVHIPCQNVLSKKKQSRPTLERGRTPVRVEKMAPFLSRYPDKAAAQFLMQGFTDGFPIPCSLSSIPPVVCNLHSAICIWRWLPQKWRRKCPCGGWVVSPLGVVPKKEPNKSTICQILGAVRSMTRLAPSCAPCPMPLSTMPLRE